MSRKNLKAASMGGNDVLTIDQLRHQDDWVLDTERYRCHVCTRNFTRFRRKHHCRKVSQAHALTSWSSYKVTDPSVLLCYACHSAVRSCAVTAR